MIHLECYNDEALALAMGKTSRQIIHHAGKGRVSHGLSKSGRPEDFGIVDQDPGQAPPPYLGQYEEVQRLPNLGLVLFRHPREGKTLIEIQPDLEPWLYKIGETLGIKPREHHLPDKYQELHTGARKHRQHLLNYLKACLQAGSPHLTKLSEWLREA